MTSGSYPARWGSAGTIYLKDNAAASGALIIDNQTVNSLLSTPLLAGPNTFFDVDVNQTGRLDIAPRNTFRLGELRLNGGRLVSGGAPFYLADEGTLAGTGLVTTAVHNHANLSPGLSVGELTLQGDLHCDASGTLICEIQNCESGTARSDRVVVEGTAHLGGTLTVLQLDDCELQHLDAFELMTYESRVGVFEHLDLPELPEQFIWQPHYGRTALTLYAIDPVIVDPVPGQGDYVTIQDALDTEPSGMVLLLADAVFTGPANTNLTLGDKSVVIRSLSGDAASCVIDCAGTRGDYRRAFTIEDAGAEWVVIENITIHDAYTEDGGAILCLEGSEPMIRGVVFENNTAIWGAGGLHVGAGSRAIVTDCVFLGNYSEHGGGGLQIDPGAEPVVVMSSSFSHNRAPSGGGGLHLAQSKGGLREVKDLAAHHFAVCRFDSNETDLRGGAVLMGDQAAEFVDCLFFGNVADLGGGAIHLQGGAHVTLSGVTVAYNESAVGAGVLVAGSSQLDADHTIIAFNLVGEAVACVEDGTATLTCSDVYGNAGGDWIGCLAGQGGDANNFSLDPLFCDGPGGDLQVYNTSPCAADNSPACGRIGALGVGCFVDPIIVALDGSGDFTDLASAIATMQSGDVLELMPGVYTGPGNWDLVLPAKNITIRSHAGRRDVPGPAFGDPSECIIDGGGAHRAFVIDEGRGLGPKLQGLTLRNTAATGRGGAILGQVGSQLILDRCVIAMSAADTGGAITHDGGMLEIRRSTFYGTAAASGGAVYCAAGTALTLSHSIMAYGSDPPVVIGEPLPTPARCSNLISLGGASGWTGFLSGLEGLFGNLSVDPLFVDATGGDYRLEPDSPCGPEWNSDCGLIGALGLYDGGTGVDPDSDPEGSVPRALRLYAAYPNPFNPLTTIRFDLPREQRVKLVVYSLRGQVVQVLRDRPLPAGRYSVVWDGCDGRGRPMPSGVYIYQLETGRRAMSRKMTLIR